MEAPCFSQSRLADVELRAGQTVRIDGKRFLAREPQTVASIIQRRSKQHSKSNSKESL
jgi:hypothetical protein